MKATEFRVGNYMYDLVGGVCQVRGITQNGIWIKDKGGPATETAFNEIPLTPEWLERLGFRFRPDKMGFYKKYSKSYRIGIIRGLSGVYHLDRYINSVHLKYVHQLQNLYFALTGEELTVKETELV